MGAAFTPPAVEVIFRTPVFVGVVVGVHHTAVVDAKLGLTVLEAGFWTVLNQPSLGERHTENTQHDYHLKQHDESGPLLDTGFRRMVNEVTTRIWLITSTKKKLCFSAEKMVQFIEKLIALKKNIIFIFQKGHL